MKRPTDSYSALFGYFAGVAAMGAALVSTKYRVRIERIGARTVQLHEAPPVLLTETEELELLADRRILDELAQSMQAGHPRIAETLRRVIPKFKYAVKREAA